MSDLFYENGKIRITKNVFSNGQGQNFVIANIKHIRDERRGKTLLPLIAGALIGIVANVHVFFPYSDYILSGFGTVLVTIYFMSKDTFLLHLTTNTAEVEAFKTNKEAVFQDVLKCLKRAVSTHNF